MTHTYINRSRLPLHHLIVVRHPDELSATTTHRHTLNCHSRLTSTTRPSSHVLDTSHSCPPPHHHSNETVSEQRRRFARRRRIKYLPTSSSYTQHGCQCRLLSIERLIRQDRNANAHITTAWRMATLLRLQNQGALISMPDDIRQWIKQQAMQQQQAARHAKRSADRRPRKRQRTPTPTISTRCPTASGFGTRLLPINITSSSIATCIAFTGAKHIHDECRRSSLLAPLRPTLPSPLPHDVQAALALAIIRPHPLPPPSLGVAV